MQLITWLDCNCTFAANSKTKHCNYIISAIICIIQLIATGYSNEGPCIKMLASGNLEIFELSHSREPRTARSAILVGPRVSKFSSVRVRSGPRVLKFS